MIKSTFVITSDSFHHFLVEVNNHGVELPGKELVQRRVVQRNTVFTQNQKVTGLNLTHAHGKALGFEAIAGIWVKWRKGQSLFNIG